MNTKIKTGNMNINTMPEDEDDIYDAVKDFRKKSAHINRETKQSEIVIEVNNTNPRWVKASDIEIEYRKTYYAKWPSGTGIKSTGKFQESDGTFFWNEQGYIPVLKKEWNQLLILDESGEAKQAEQSVKATLKLPPLDKEIFVTVDGRKCVGKFYEGGKSFSYRNFSNFGNIVERDFYRIEWLDETTQSESVSNNT